MPIPMNFVFMSCHCNTAYSAISKHTQRTTAGLAFLRIVDPVFFFGCTNSSQTMIQTGDEYFQLDLLKIKMDPLNLVFHTVYGIQKTPSV